MARQPQSLDDLPANAVRPLGTLSAETLRAWTQAAGQRFIWADLDALTERKALLKAIGRAFEFPQWYGANLDALYDCLTDLPDRNGPVGYVIVLDGLPSGEARENAESVLDVFRDAAEEFARNGIAMRVFYR
ncbi:MAG TPA: barstar family protein [Burkholderiaceae bacterium]|nr:barstar family protein [Burkholderiaceae bacterium]